MSVSRPVALADWGTSSFRLWRLDEAGRVVGERRSEEGLIAAGAIGFSKVLEGHLAALGAPDDLPVVACGMIGARSGWAEAAYLETPVHLSEIARRATPVPSARRPVAILPGICQRSTATPDVMRGEETKLLGLGTDADGLVAMPGTHTKWARIEAGRLTGFSTVMTGEIFAHMRAGERSVLRGAVEDAEPVSAGDPSFLAAVGESLAAPELTTNRLFGLRAGWLIEGWSPTNVLARLSGLLIGLEIAGAARIHGDLSGTTLISGGPSSDLYAAALSAAGFADIRRVDADTAVLAGLSIAARLILEPTPEGAFA